MPVNMAFNEVLAQSIAILVAMILLGTFLRRIGVLKEEYGPIFARIVTDVTLPALIFLAVSQHPVRFGQLLPPAVLVVAEVVSGFAAWGVGRALRLSRPQLGALILASMFGSSAFLGYAVIKDLFQGDTRAIAEAAMISEFGVGLLIFTVGVAIAMRFGANNSTWRDAMKPALVFFRSPIFIALISGIVVSLIGVPKESQMWKLASKILETIANANTLMVTMTIGIMLKFHDLRKALPVVILACGVKLVLQPVSAGLLADIMHFSDDFRGLVVIEAAMPSAALSAVFAKRYACDGELASVLVFATFISSIFTVVSISFFIG